MYLQTVASVQWRFTLFVLYRYKLLTIIIIVPSFWMVLGHRNLGSRIWLATKGHVDHNMFIHVQLNTPAIDE